MRVNLASDPAPLLAQLGWAVAPPQAEHRPPPCRVLTHCQQTECGPASALLRAISEREWAQCERGMLSDGGDVRVSSCVWTFGGVGLTQLPGLLSGLSRHRCEGGGKVGGEGGGGGGGNRSAASAYFAKRRALLRSLKKP